MYPYTTTFPVALDKFKQTKDKNRLKGYIEYLFSFDEKSYQYVEQVFRMQAKEYMKKNPTNFETNSVLEKYSQRAHPVNPSQNPDREILIELSYQLTRLGIPRRF